MAHDHEFRAYHEEFNARSAYHREQGRTPREAVDLAFEETRCIRQRLDELWKEQRDKEKK